MLKKFFHKQFLLELFLSAILVAVLHYLALVYILYWIIEWFDILMHFLGGYVMGLLATFIFFTSGYIKATYELRHNFVIVFLFIMMFTLVIALGWELWEVFFGFSHVLTDRVDTVVDIIMGLVGAFAAFLYVGRRME